MRKDNALYSGMTSASFARESTKRKLDAQAKEGKQSQLLPVASQIFEIFAKRRASIQAEHLTTITTETTNEQANSVLLAYRMRLEDLRLLEDEVLNLVRIDKRRLKND